MTLSGYVYKCAAGESWDLIARKLYGDEKYAAELLCANPGKSDIVRFSGGEILEMPVAEIAEDRYSRQISAAPWKE